VFKFIGDKKGTIFMIVMILTMLMVLIAVAGSNMLLQDMHTVQYLRYNTEAQHIAEAGINVAVATLADDFDLSVFPLNAGLGDGEYNVTVTQADGRILLTSVGTLTQGPGGAKNISKTAAAEVEDLTPSAMNYIMSAGNNVRIRAGFASLTDINGSIHGNNNVQLRTGLLLGFMDVSETATYTTDDDTQVYIRVGWLSWINVDGVQYSGGHDAHHDWNHAAVNFPEFDYGYYRDQAIDSGDYYAGDQIFDDKTLNPANGVVYVEGTATFHGTNHLYGGLMADEIVVEDVRTGWFSRREGKLQQHKAGDKNVIVSRSGDIRIGYGKSGWVSLRGELEAEEALIYAESDFVVLETGARVDVNGVIIAGSGDINLWEFFAYITYTHAMPVVKFGPDVDLARIVSWNR